MGGHDGDAPSPNSCSGISNGHSISTRWSENGRTRLDGRLPKFESEGEIEEVKLSAEENLLLREACKRTKLV